jgi:hypothetical protein
VVKASQETEKQSATQDALRALARSVSLGSSRIMTPAKVEEPFSWDMPNKGTEWCSCEKTDCLTRKVILGYAKDVVEDEDWVTHEELVFIISNLWDYEDTCEFFLMAVNRSAVFVNGRVAVKYELERSLEIASYFSKTWNGCPAEICDNHNQEH